MTTATNDILDLVLDVGRTNSRNELHYIMVNRSAEVAEYDRAGLWEVGRKPKLLAINGVASLNSKSSFAVAWRELIRTVPLTTGIERLSDRSGRGGWEALRKANPDIHALWLPLPGTNLALALDRRGRDFTAIEMDDLAKLAEGYSLAFRAMGPARGGHRRFALVAILLLSAALYWVKVPMSVVAPCEVVARKPYVVTTPAAGVIESVTVEPGQRVSAGETVAMYEGQSGRRLKIVAGMTGVVEMNNPAQWNGRSVGAGDVVMHLVDPLDGRVRIWLSPDEQMEVDRERPAAIRLVAYGGTVHEAEVIAVGKSSEYMPNGKRAIPADADWLDRNASNPPLGATGEATLYGPKERLYAWIVETVKAKTNQYLR